MIEEPPAIDTHPHPLKAAADRVVELRQRLYADHHELREAYSEFLRLGREHGFTPSVLDGLFGRVG